MHSLIAHFQDLSKDDSLVMVCVLVLTKTQTTLDKNMFFYSYQELTNFYGCLCYQIQKQKLK
jgi:hypothetical protein